jgi:hypothetical protein
MHCQIFSLKCAKYFGIEHLKIILQSSFFHYNAKYKVSSRVNKKYCSVFFFFTAPNNENIKEIIMYPEERKHGQAFWNDIVLELQLN